MKKVVKGVLVVGVVVLGGLFINNKIADANAKAKLEEQQLVNSYVSCLEDNFTQRDYCARQLNKNYNYMDQLIKKYGYSYKQVGYDLYVERG